MKGTKVSSQELVALEQQLKTKKEEIDLLLQSGIATDQQLVDFKSELETLAEETLPKIERQLAKEITEAYNKDRIVERQAGVDAFVANGKEPQFKKCRDLFYDLQERVEKALGGRKNQQEENKVSSQELSDLEQQLKVRKEEIDPQLQNGTVTNQQLTNWKNDLNALADDFNKIQERMVVELAGIHTLYQGAEEQEKGKEYNQRTAQFNRCLNNYYIPAKRAVFNEINTRKDQQEEEGQKKIVSQRK